MPTKEREDVRLERSPKEIWRQAQEILAKKLKEPSFRAFIKPTQLTEITEDEAIITVSNDFGRSTITGKHLTAISEALSRVLGRRISARVVVDTSMVDEDYNPSIAAISVNPSHNNRLSSSSATPAPYQSVQHAGTSNLNLKYTFSSFVVGSNNRFTHSASLAVADRPGQAYNPLFIWGGVGLGKTHILQAIGHHVLSKHPQLVVLYISCERFTNDLINSIRDDRMLDFRKRYRQVDVLLIDDIQFIAGKESTQMEFFHTFNALRDSGRQIVLSSDRPPKAIASLEERLRSRFEWGLISDIQAPDFETRLAILRQKSQVDNMSVADEVLEYIAYMFSSNIRELEGALIQAHAYASLTGITLTAKTAAEVLRPQGQSKPKPALTIEMIVDAVASHYRIEPSQLKSSNRSQDLTLPRHIAMHLCHELIPMMSLPRIGDAFAKRKHTSVIYACNRIKEAISKEQAVAEAVRQITHQLKV